MVCKQCWGLGVRHVQLTLILCSFAIIHIFKVSPMLAIHLAQAEVQDSSSYHEDPFKNIVVNWELEDIVILDYSWLMITPFASFLGGVLSVKWDNKIILLLAVFSMSIQSYAIPSMMSSKSGKVGWSTMYALRILMGLFEGISIPVSYQIMGRWVTSMDYCKASTVMVLGNLCGRLLIYSIVYFIGKSVMGWASVFYTSGNIGLLWCVAWFTFGSKDFRNCFYISTEERTFIVNHTVDLDTYSLGPFSEKRPIMWKQIFTSKDIYILLISDSLVSWVKSSFLSPWLIEYYLETAEKVIRDGHDRFVNKDELFFLIYFLLVLLVLILGVLADFVVNYKKVVTSHQRKTCNSIGLWGQAVCFVLIGYSKSYKMLKAMVYMHHAMAALSTIGSDVAYLEMAPNYAGLTYAISRSISSIPQAILINYRSYSDLIVSQDRNFFRRDVFTAALLYFSSNFIYVIGFNTKVQEWNKTSQTHTKQVSVMY